MTTTTTRKSAADDLTTTYPTICLWDGTEVTPTYISPNGMTAIVDGQVYLCDADEGYNYFPAVL